jgi:hypothetical protein
MANDYIVNYTLKNEQLGEMPPGGLYDPNYTDEMTSEEVYELLEKNCTQIKMTLDDAHRDGRRGRLRRRRQDEQQRQR